MKRIITICIILSCSLLSAKAQERCDSIFFKTGKIVLGNVKTVYDEKIEFTYLNEDVLNVLSTSNITKVVFRSGRTETYNAVADSPEITDEDLLMEGRTNQLRTRHEGKVYMIPQGVSWSLDIVLSNDAAFTCRAIIDAKGVLYKAFVDKMNAMLKGARFISHFGKDTSVGRASSSKYLIKLSISHIDEDDGEVYGFIEYIANGETIYSEYFNGNGAKGPLYSGMSKSVQAGVYNMFMRK